jgi:hypothetical protein
MRLVKFGGNGDLNDLSLVEFTDRNIPPYAIISHTWGESSEEVTFQDIISGIGKNKAGYRKLRFCEVQALVDGLQYFWIDTCCIDKSSSAELQEAINSMFRWYQNAAVCYVYLSDVSTTAHVWQPPRQTLKPDLQRSRWFTRCWTLQELLAPRTVQFFSCEGKPLGDKQSLRQEIHEITGIPIQALEGQPLSEFTIVERISWTARRESKREEDASYCLLGIFDVHMPVIYGEGRNNAFTRLEREILLTTQGTSRSALHGFFALLSENRADPITAAPHISNTEEPKTDFNGASDTDSESEIISIFSDEEGSASSASSVGPNPVQTVGIREVSRVLLNQEDLKTLYMMAVLKLERRKARVHIRGFLKEYGQNLLREASNGVLEIQAAKFVQQLAGRIADEINWNIAGFETENEQESLKLDNKLEKNDLETWLSSLQPQSADIEEQPANIVEGVDEDEYDNELDNDLQFPNIEKVKGFLLGSEAFKDYVKAMRKWLKVDESQVEDHENHDEDIDNQAINMPVNTYAEEEEEEEEAKRTFVGFATPTTGHSRAGNREGLVAEIQLHSQHDDEQEPRSRSRGPQNRNSVTDLLSGFLNFWHISFYFYDIVELFVPRIRSGYKRLRWRCVSQNALDCSIMFGVHADCPSRVTVFSGETFLLTTMAP